MTSEDDSAEDAHARDRDRGGDSPRPTLEGAILLSVPADLDRQARTRIMWFLGGVLRRSVEVHTYESNSSVEYDSPQSSFLAACRRLFESWRRF